MEHKDYEHFFTITPVSSKTLPTKIKTSAQRNIRQIRGFNWQAIAPWDVMAVAPEIKAPDVGSDRRTWIRGGRRSARRTATSDGEPQFLLVGGGGSPAPDLAAVAEMACTSGWFPRERRRTGLQGTA
uniref:Uncharacterized protein n=1 Tax=Aegilops tauschii TaxID=37682 RepID=M8BKB1_AEGTA